MDQGLPRDVLETAEFVLKPRAIVDLPAWK
jgi:hypothetical protein